MESIAHPSTANETYVHLLVADDHVINRSFGPYTTVCGREVTKPGAVAGDDTPYCPDCADEALRWSAGAPTAPSV